MSDTVATRLTKRNLRAIETALNQALAGPLDGFDEGSEDESEMVAAMGEALTKVQRRLDRG